MLNHLRRTIYLNICITWENLKGLQLTEIEQKAKEKPNKKRDVKTTKVVEGHEKV